MTKRKKNRNNDYSSDWKISLLIIGIAVLVVVIMFGINHNWFSGESETIIEKSYVFNGVKYDTYEAYKQAIDNYEEDKVEMNKETYCYNGECYTNYQDYSNAMSYEEADEKWQEHVSIVNSDLEKIEDILESYCYDVPYEQIPYCYDVLLPRLDVSANHLVNAERFLNLEGSVFGNKETLMAGLEDKAVYVKSVANWLSTTVSQYNDWVAMQDYEEEISRQREQAIYDTISIMSGFM